MPLYSYKCTKCETEFDILQTMDDDPLTKCIHCEGEVYRMITSTGVIFKGSGFYATDERNN